MVLEHIQNLLCACAQLRIWRPISQL